MWRVSTRELNLVRMGLTCLALLVQQLDHGADLLLNVLNPAVVLLDVGRRRRGLLGHAPPADDRPSRRAT